MAEPQFKKIQDHNGSTRYMKNGKFVDVKKVPAATLETIEAAGFNQLVDEDGNLIEPGDGVEGKLGKDADASDLENDEDDLDEDETEDEDEESGEEDDDESEDEDEEESDEEESDDEEEEDDESSDDEVDATPAAAEPDASEKPKKKFKSPEAGAMPIAPTPAAAAAVRQAKIDKKKQKKEKLRPGQVPQSDPGMGFPRVDGKTVDIFDKKTPHTHVRNVQGVMVPLSEENYNTKTDAEVMDQLAKLGMF